MPAILPWSTVLTIAILASAVVAFALGRFRSDVIAVWALLGLTLSGILTPAEALSGFSNSIIPILASLFIIGGAVVRSGLTTVISDKLLGIAGENHNALFMLIMLVTAIIGSLVSNSGTVAIMMPIVVRMALSLNVSPSRFLMPLAFMSSMGGMLTLIGNPPNMVVNEVWMAAGFPSLTLFSILPVGIACLLFGMFILAPATSYFLARRKNVQNATEGNRVSLKALAERYHLARNIYKIIVPARSTLVGKSLLTLGLTAEYGVVIREIRRERHTGAHFVHMAARQIVPEPQTVIQANDILYCLGTPDNVQALAAAHDLRPVDTGGETRETDKYRFDAMGICELVIMSSSPLAKRTVEESGLREQFGISLLGIHRGDQYILDNIRERVILPGDSLLVQGTWDNIARLEDRPQHWVVVGKPRELAGSRALRGKIPFVGAVLVLMIAGMATGLLPTVAAVMLAAALTIAGGCFRNVEEAYSFINWESIVLIACILPMAIAMEKAGLAAGISAFLLEYGASHGPWAALAAVYALTSAMNVFVSSTPVTLLIAPVALRIALDLGCSPLPFLFGVATAAAMCFASPFSTPSNALVMSTGRYAFLDYVKIGLPLQALMGVFMVLVLPLLFPF